MNQTENKRGACCSALGKWAIVAVVLAVALVVLTWASAERRKNILQTASALPECSTFVELVDKAGLGPTLAKDGPFTVFVPTNDAFAKVSQEKLTSLLNDKSALSSLLLYHMTPEALSIEQISAPTTRDTCVVPKTPIACSGEKYGDAVYIQKNIPCVNGVVYIIDTVQIPPFLAGVFAPPVGAPNAPSTPIPAPIPAPTPNAPQASTTNDSAPVAEIGAVEVVATEEVAEPDASDAPKADEPKKSEPAAESTEKADAPKSETAASPEKTVEKPAEPESAPADESTEKAAEPKKSPSDAPVSAR